MRDYGKVHSTFWTSGSIDGLDADAKLLALYLLTSPHGNMIGAYKLPDAYATADIGWDSERLRNGLQTLSESGFIQYQRDGKGQWVWIVHFMRFNRPDNPNMWKASAKLANALPDALAFKSGVLGTVLEPLPNLPSPSPSPSSVLEEGAGETKPAKSDPIPYQAIADGYNATMPLAKVREVTAKRKTAIRRAWLESPKRQSLAFWTAYFEECADDPFLNGTGPYREPHANWRPDFDYLLKPDVVTRVYERAMHRVEQGNG